jgi:hypothetical protein
MAQSSRDIYRSAAFADFRRLGLTHVEFCQLRYISVRSFRKWFYRLRLGLPPRRPRSTRWASSPTHIPAQHDTPTFLPVHARSQPLRADMNHPALRPPTPLELVLGDQCHLRVPAGFDSAALHQLLDVLEQRS